MTNFQEIIKNAKVLANDSEAGLDQGEFLQAALPGYRILEKIHQGGQGIVYKAVQEKANRQVAIKVLMGGPISTDEQKERFKREVSLIARLTHPNIVRLFDTGVVSNFPYYAMQYIEGLPITEHAELCDLRARLEIFIKVCTAVSHAHQRGVIHRDLKPSNIMVDTDGNPFVLDFGLAKEVESHSTDISMPGRVPGTLQYLSPEQASGQSLVPDVRSDIYALGVILHEVITSELPYRVDTLRNIVENEPKKLRQSLEDKEGWVTDKDIDDDIEAIVSKALRKYPDERYQSVAELQDDLQHYLKGDPVSARGGSTFYMVKKISRKYRYQIIGTGVFLFGTILGLSLMWRDAANARDKLQKVADASMAGMQMGGYLRIGSTERDAGRIEDAVKMHKQALEIASTVEHPTESFDIVLCDALLRSVELDIITNDLASAEIHLGQLDEVMDRNARSTDPQWKRIQGYKARNYGRVEYRKKNWEGALPYLRESVKIRAELLAEDSSNPRLKSEMSSIHRNIGFCYKRLGNMKSALWHSTESYKIRQDLAESNPSIENRISLQRSRINLSSLFLLMKTEEADAEAQALLAEVALDLPTIETDEDAATRLFDIKKVRNGLQQNLRILGKRDPS